jgi:hypothetical protein
MFNKTKLGTIYITTDLAIKSGLVANRLWFRYQKYTRWAQTLTHQVHLARSRAKKTSKSKDQADHSEPCSWIFRTSWNKILAESSLMKLHKIRWFVFESMHFDWNCEYNLKCYQFGMWAGQNFAFQLVFFRTEFWPTRKGYFLSNWTTLSQLKLLKTSVSHKTYLDPSEN